jgi:hypothetical protein
MTNDQRIHIVMPREAGVSSRAARRESFVIQT